MTPLKRWLNTSSKCSWKRPDCGENVVEPLQRDDVCPNEVSESLQKLVDNDAIKRTVRTG